MLRKFDGDEQANLDAFFVAQRLKFRQVNASTEYARCMHSAAAVRGSGRRLGKSLQQINTSTAERGKKTHAFWKPA